MFNIFKKKEQVKIEPLTLDERCKLEQLRKRKSELKKLNIGSLFYYCKDKNIFKRIYRTIKAYFGNIKELNKLSKDIIKLEKRVLDNNDKERFDKRIEEIDKQLKTMDLSAAKNIVFNDNILVGLNKKKFEYYSNILNEEECSIMRNIILAKQNNVLTKELNDIFIILDKKSYLLDSSKCEFYDIFNGGKRVL